jgi:hypothetical protein
VADDRQPLRGVLIQLPFVHMGLLSDQSPRCQRCPKKKKTVRARYAHNDRLIDALMSQAFSALQASPGARAYYDRQRARGAGHNPALRQLANRLTGILHGCLKTRTLYNETTAWPQYATKTEKAAA